jgi:hypothetical protein
MKIETWSFRFLGKPFEVPVHFPPRKGEFVATMSDEIAEQLTGQVYEGKQISHDFKELHKRIAGMIDDRERQLLEKEVTKKLIGYRVELSGCFDYQVNGRKRTFSGEGGSCPGVMITWRILMHSKIGDREQYRDEDGRETYLETRNGYNRKQGERTMEWTPEREEFFRAMESQLQAMILKLDQFFYKASHKKLLAAIDGRQVALPAPKESA